MAFQKIAILHCAGSRNLAPMSTARGCAGITEAAQLIRDMLAQMHEFYRDMRALQRLRNSTRVGGRCKVSALMKTSR
jgi:hypothetical protein